MPTKGGNAEDMHGTNTRRYSKLQHEEVRQGTNTIRYHQVQLREGTARSNHEGSTR